MTVPPLVFALSASPSPHSRARPTAGAPGTAASTARAAAHRLARASARVIRIRTPALSPATARRFARVRQRAIPLPAGGNFNGVRWRLAPSPLSPGTAEQTLEYNARCQWLRAEAERRDPSAGEVVRSAGDWPALRALPAQPVAALLADCYASHRREVAEALRRNMVASS